MADTKLSALTELSTLSATDQLYVTPLVTGTRRDRRMTLRTLSEYIGAVIPDAFTGAAIQSALDDADGSSGGCGVVHLREGTYTVSNTILIPSGTRLIGAGIGSTILVGPTGGYAGAGSVFGSIYSTIGFDTSTGSSVEGVTIDHAQNGTTANGITLARATDCVVRDCQVLGFDSHQYCIWNRGGSGNKILNNIVDGGVLSSSPSSEQEGIECYGGTGILVSGNTVRNVGANGLYVNPDSTDTVDGVVFSDNQVTGCYVGAKTSPGGSMVGVSFSGNAIGSCWLAGIRITLSTVECKDISLVGNQIRDCPLGLDIVGTSSSTWGSVIVSGNIIDGSTGAVAQINLTYAGNVHIAGNVLSDGAAAGVYMSSCYKGVVLCGNTIRNHATHGVFITACDSPFVMGNMISGYSTAGSSDPGVRSESTDHCVVQGNVFDGPTDAQAVYIANGDSGVSGPNRVLSAATGGPFNRNDSTNPDQGTFTMTAASATKDVSNTQFRTGSRVMVTQTGGTPTAFLASVTSNGTLTVTFASVAAGTEVFEYRIMQ